MRLVEADVRRLGPVRREAAQCLGADPGAGRELDDRLQDDERAAGLHQRGQPFRDLVAAQLLADAGLDDQGRGVREHLHQRAVALGQRRVGGEAGRAERAVERAVAEHHRDRHVAADPRQPRGRQPHRRGEVLDVRDDRRQLPVQDRLAERRVLLLGDALLEQERHRRLDHLEVLGGAVQPGQERHREVQAALRGTQQLGHLLLGVRALPPHAWYLDRSGRQLHRRPRRSGRPGGRCRAADCAGAPPSGRPRRRARRQRALGRPGRGRAGRRAREPRPVGAGRAAGRLRPVPVGDLRRERHGCLRPRGAGRARLRPVAAVPLPATVPRRRGARRLHHVLGVRARRPDARRRRPAGPRGGVPAGHPGRRAARGVAGDGRGSPDGEPR